MNEHGLAVSLAFGGRRDVDDGFGIPLVLRYILEFCKTVDEALAVLERVPSHMAYSIGLIDAERRFATVYVGPGAKPELVDRKVATNHQNRVEWPEHGKLTKTVERQKLLEGRVDHPDEDVETFVSRFMKPPVLSTEYERAFGTLYTAIYWPRKGEVEYRWPNRSWHQSFNLFVEGTSIIDYLESPERKSR
jgi:predicted choloylglycine hydrolase